MSNKAGLVKHKSEPRIAVKTGTKLSKSNASVSDLNGTKVNNSGVNINKTIIKEHPSTGRERDQAKADMKIGDKGDGKPAGEDKQEKTLKKDGVDMMRRQCLVRGVSDLKSFGVAFRQFDKDFSREINFQEFKHGLRSFQMELDEGEQRELFDQFDQDRSGTIDFQEFSDHLSPPIEGRRLETVHSVFNKLDQSGDGVLQTEDIIDKFSERSRNHPKYQSGEWTETQVIKNMLAAFEQPDSKDGELTRDEFVAYYSQVSAWVQDDSYFEKTLEACWGIE